MAVAEVLILVPFIWLGRVVAAGRSFGRRVGGEQCGALIEVERDVVLQMNRVARISAGGKIHRAATRCRRGLDGLVDGVGVERLAVAGGAEVFDVERARADRRRRVCIGRAGSNPGKNDQTRGDCREWNGLSCFHGFLCVIIFQTGVAGRFAFCRDSGANSEPESPSSRDSSRRSRVRIGSGFECYRG